MPDEENPDTLDPDKDGVVPPEDDTDPDNDTDPDDDGVVPPEDDTDPENPPPPPPPPPANTTGVIRFSSTVPCGVDNKDGGTTVFETEVRATIRTTVRSAPAAFRDGAGSERA